MFRNFNELKDMLKNDNIKISNKYVVRGLSFAWWIIRIGEGFATIIFFLSIYTYMTLILGA